MESISITTNRASRPVDVDGQAYTLVELDGEGRGRYTRALFDSAERVGDRWRPKDPSALELLLVHLSLRDPQNQAVPLETLQSWSGRAIERLASAAEAINGLDEGGAEEAKNG